MLNGKIALILTSMCCKMELLIQPYFCQKPIHAFLSCKVIILVNSSVLSLTTLTVWAVFLNHLPFQNNYNSQNVFTINSLMHYKFDH